MRHNSFLDIWMNSVKKYPHKTAVIDPDSSITYKDLDIAARTIGYAINQQTGNIKNKPIILFMDKSCSCVAGMIGIQYSGNIYVPMDTKTPLSRFESIIQTLESDYILTTESDKRFLDKIGYTGQHIYTVECLTDDYSSSYYAEIIEKNISNIIDTDLMYILFTSGSTGIPKGVAIMHRSLIDYVENAGKYVGITEEDIVGNQAPFYADMSLRDIYMTLTVGGTLCLIPNKYFITPKKVLEYMDQNNVTFTIWVPTAYNILMQYKALDKCRPNNLRTICFSGEAMPIPVFNYLKSYYPDATYRQFYGPTEITGSCTYFTVRSEYADDATIPIGKPFPNTGLFLIDQYENIIPDSTFNVEGEICVFGSCLAAGYYNNPEKTLDAFVQNPLFDSHPSLMYRTGDLAYRNEDGNLVFTSRKDYQIKHGGRRIELGEIESAASTISEVDVCCCIHDGQKDELILYYVGNIDQNELKQSIAVKLPPYMIPSKLLKINQMPQLPNGKMDRVGLAKSYYEDYSK